MNPPATQECPEPARSSHGETREPRPERGQSKHPSAPVQAPLQTPSQAIEPAQPTVTTTPYDGTPINKGTDNAPTSGMIATKSNGLERIRTFDLHSLGWVR